MCLRHNKKHLPYSVFFRPINQEIQFGIAFCSIATFPGNKIEKLWSRSEEHCVRFNLACCSMRTLCALKIENFWFRFLGTFCASWVPSRTLITLTIHCFSVKWKKSIYHCRFLAVYLMFPIQNKIIIIHLRNCGTVVAYNDLLESINTISSNQ